MTKSLLLAFGAIGSICAVAPARAEVSATPELRLSQLEQVADEDLAGERGGFRWQGVDVQFGAEMRSYLNNQLVLQTNVTWTSAGASMTREVSGALSPVDAAQLQAGILNGSGLNMRVGDEEVFLANGGQTAFIQRSDGALQNVIINTANNVEIRQEVDAQLDLGNFQPFQTELISQRIATSLADMVQLGTTSTLGN
jgi:hypothetical protein